MLNSVTSILEIDDFPVRATFRHGKSDDCKRLRKQQLFQCASFLYEGCSEDPPCESHADEESVSSFDSFHEAGPCLQTRFTIVERLYVQLTEIAVVCILKDDIHA